MSKPSDIFEEENSSLFETHKEATDSSWKGKVISIEEIQAKERQRIKEEVEKMKKTKKTGIIEMVFGKSKTKIKAFDNIDIGYNQAIEDVLRLL